MAAVALVCKIPQCETVPDKNCSKEGTCLTGKEKPKTFF